MSSIPSCKIIIAMDSFKGCLSSSEAGQAVMEEIRENFPSIEVACIPVSDGGDGMLDVLMQATGGKYITFNVHDPLMHLHTARYGLSPDGRTAFIEMAIASGINLVPPAQRNPMLTSTYGTGELIRDALKRGCRDFIIGLGGSATNDAGLGMLQALGFRFLNSQKEVLGTRPGEAMNGMLMGEVASVDTSCVCPELWEARFLLACDVQAPFHGLQGAAYVFAPQKGADENIVKALDRNLEHIASVIRQETGKDIAKLPGAGAAGGMGGAMIAFLDATIKPGAKVMLNALRFKERIAEANLVITGEGKSDRQTLMGKIPSGILEEAIRQGIPTLLLSGSIEDVDELNRAGFLGVFSTTPYPMPLAQAMMPHTAQDNIRKATRQIIRVLLYDLLSARDKHHCPLLTEST